MNNFKLFASSFLSISFVEFITSGDFENITKLIVQLVTLIVTIWTFIHNINHKNKNNQNVQ